MCLGLDQGNILKPFREFQFAEASVGEWIGEDSIFTATNSVNYTARAKTTLIVLEIATIDFKRILLSDYRAFMENISLHKHLLLMGRFEDIIEEAKRQHEAEDLKVFYDSCVRTLI